MFKKLVRHDDWHFLEVDPVRLKRKAIKLREQIDQKVPPADDRYGFRKVTLPIIDAAVRGEILESLNLEKSKFISGNFQRAKQEGDLPPEYDEEFLDAVAGFLVTVQGLMLDPSDEVVVDGVSYRWADFESDGDGPNDVRYW